jgi:hypothetical protein
MQAVGWGGAAISLTILIQVILSAQAQASWGPPRVPAVMDRMLVYAVLFLLGHLFLGFAGRGLTIGRTSAARFYVIGGGALAVALVLYMGWGEPLLSLLPLLAGALAWPLVTLLAVRLCPRTEAELVHGQVPDSEDRGRSGLGVAMVIASVLELLCALAASYIASIASEMRVYFAVTAVALFVRGFVQADTARRMLQGKPTADAARLYAWIGMGSAVVAWAAGALSARDVMATLMLGGGAAVLFVWPFVVRHFAVHGDIEEADPGRAPDRGLTAVGWIVLFVSAPEALGALFAIPAMISSTTSGGPWFWITAAGGLAGTWAGLELVYTTQRAAVAVATYAASGIALAIWMAKSIADGQGFTWDLASGGIAAAASLALPLTAAALFARLRHPPV